MDQRRPSKAKRTVKGLLLACAAVFIMAVPAFAVGTQYFGPVSFNGKYTTPNYSTSNTGTHSITALVSSCGRYTSYTDRLVRVRPWLPDIFYSPKTAACGSYVTRSWSAAAISYDTGTFHYDIEKTSGGTAQGHFSWP